MFIILGAILLGIQVLPLEAGDPYTTSTSHFATNLTITMELYYPKNSSFYRAIEFRNMHGAKRRMYMLFNRTSGNVFVGTPYNGDLRLLEDIAEPNMRSHWDNMYFVNPGYSGTLRIKWMVVWIEYNNHVNSSWGNWDPDILIAYETNKTLYSGQSSFKFSPFNGRYYYVRDYFGYNTIRIHDLPSCVQWIIYDLGKSGSSDASDSQYSDNPKYGLTGEELCSELISWYYHETGIKVVDFWHNPGAVYDFKDVDFCGDMMAYFHRSNKRYDYDPGTGRWYKIKSNDEMDFSASAYPQPGDLLNRMRQKWNPRSGTWTQVHEHAMMILRWNDKSKEAWVIDGPFPLAIRRVPVGQLAAAGTKEFSLGKIPR